MAHSFSPEVGPAHDPVVCDADPAAGPSLHSGLCPAWAVHHNLPVAQASEPTLDDYAAAARHIERGFPGRRV